MKGHYYCKTFKNTVVM